jgi:hypothetical protein
MMWLLAARKVCPELVDARGTSGHMSFGSTDDPATETTVELGRPGLI